MERVRTSGRAFERLVDYLQARRDDGCDAFFVQHIDAGDRAVGWSSAAARSTAPTPSSCRRWAR